MTDTLSDQLQFDPLPPETWGQRLRRAREQQGKMALEAAALAIGKQWRWSISHSTLGRIESYEEAPPSNKPKHRVGAIYALLTYGVSPADFGLSLDELPQPAAQHRARPKPRGRRGTSEQDKPGSRCSPVAAGRAA